MTSSVQFSIRSLMILMVIVAVISAVVAPRIQGLEPEGRWRVMMFLVPAGMVGSLFTTLRCLQRRRAERAAGQMLLRSDSRVKSTAVTDLIVAALVSALAAYIAFEFASADKSEFLSTGPLFGAITLLLTLVATELWLHWWWRTGPRVTEFFSNGLLLRGFVLKEWSNLSSYQTSPEGPAVLLVNESTRRGLHQRRIHIDAEDQAKVEQILIDHGVLFAMRLLLRQGE